MRVPSAGVPVARSATSRTAGRAMRAGGVATARTGGGVRVGMRGAKAGTGSGRLMMASIEGSIVPAGMAGAGDVACEDADDEDDPDEHERAGPRVGMPLVVR